MSDIPEWAMNEALGVLRAADEREGGELLVVAMEKEIARAILAAEERATLRERERYAPAVRLLAAWDACNAHDATYEQAYYRLAKYARNDWEALREAITQKENSE